MHKLRVGSLGSTIRHQNAFREASKAFLGFSFWVAPRPPAAEALPAGLPLGALPPDPRIWGFAPQTLL